MVVIVVIQLVLGALVIKLLMPVLKWTKIIKYLYILAFALLAFGQLFALKYNMSNLFIILHGISSIMMVYPALIFKRSL